MKNLAIVLFIVFRTCFIANAQDVYGADDNYDDGDTDQPTSGPGCNNSMPLVSECELPRPAVEMRLRTEEDALRLADCWLHCLDMLFPQEALSQTMELEGFPTLKTVSASLLNSAMNRRQIFECRRGCEARAFDPQRTTQDCTTACVGNCENAQREERCLMLRDVFDFCNRTLCQIGCAFQSPTGMPQRVPIAPTHVPELNPPNNPPMCKERAGVYHIGNVSSFTKLNASFNPSGYTTYVFRVQSMDNASLSTYIWLPESTHQLTLSDFACSNVSISYAVVSRTNMTQYSPVLNLSVYGANQDPDNGFPHRVDYRSVTRELELDERSQFIRKYWTFRFSWERPIGNLTGYKIDVNYRSSDGIGGMSQNLSKDVTSFTFFSDSNTSIFLSAGSTISRLQITTLPMAIQPTTNSNRQPTVIECQNILPDIQQVINHTALQLTCVSQWNSSRYQYSTALRFNLSEPSFVAFIDLFHIVGEVLNERIIATINPRTNNDTNEYTYQGRYQNPSNDNYEFRVSVSYKPDNELQQLQESCEFSLLPPRPSPPVNVVVQSSSITDHDPSSFVVSINLMLQQANETSARINDLRHEFIITTTPVVIDSTNQDGVMSLATTLINEDMFQGNTSMLFTTAESNPNFTCLYLQLRSVYSVPVLQNQLFRSVWSSPVVLYRNPNQTNCSLPFNIADNSVNTSSGELTNSPSVPMTTTTPLFTTDVMPDFTTRTVLLSVLVPFGIVLLLLVSLLIIVLIIRRQRRKPNFDISSTDWAGKEMHSIFLSEHNGLTEQHTLQPDDWELNHKSIVTDEKLGEGAFGVVYRGVIIDTSNNPHVKALIARYGNAQVAVKFLKMGASGSERFDFLNEIDLMKKIASYKNSHVVNMVGCITIHEPLCLVTEFAEHGDLQTFLKTCRKKLMERKRNPETADSLYSDLGELKSEDLVSFAYQIASGMDFLASLNVVHRDLACRNILVGQGKTLKITDFGLSRLLSYDNVYVKTTQGRLPLKWMSIESIIDREFTTASDVWSYGVTLWEIATLGSMPYPTINNEDMLVMLKRGYRMERPENCSVEVYQLMLQCWQEHPNDRPNFVQLRGEFDRMLSKQKNAEELYIFIQAEETTPVEETCLKPKISKLELNEKPEDPTACTEVVPGDGNRSGNPYIDHPVTTPVDAQHILGHTSSLGPN